MIAFLSPLETLREPLKLDDMISTITSLIGYVLTEPCSSRSDAVVDIRIADGGQGAPHIFYQIGDGKVKANF